MLDNMRRLSIDRSFVTRIQLFKGMEEFDLCIVGAGMFGSSAAKYASVDPSLHVCLIGPDEPENFASRDIFSAHYDEGRVTRVIDVDPICQRLAKLSIVRYKEIERLSEIPFYGPVGTIFIGEKGSKYTVLMEQACAATKLPVEDISDLNIFKKKFPFLRLNDDEIALLDSDGAGYISARKLVAAQQEIARKQGCRLIREVVSKIEDCTEFDSSMRVKIITDSGNAILAKRALICTGAFVNCRQLLPHYGSLMPDMKVVEETAALLEISEEEAERLRTMPSILYDHEHYPNLSHKISAYILPPNKYPDGNWYIKIGHGQEYLKELYTGEEIKEWYLSSGNSEIMQEYASVLQDLLPGLVVRSTTKISCVTTRTPSSLPYIDRVTPVLTVAIGGNGKSAKMSDELGRLASCLSLNGKWDSEFPQSLFSLQWKFC